MKNFQVTDKETGKTYWISRSMAVCVINRVHMDDGSIRILISQRGPGCPDNIGKWNLCCGYLDFDETTKEAAAREMYEELGVKVDPSKMIFLNYNDKVSENRQNVTFRFLIDLNYKDIKKYLDNPDRNRGGEKDEVSDIRLIKVEDISKYDWAFNHDKLLYEHI